jgi:hypothetical protein
VADLNIPDPPAGADPQLAAGFNVVPAAVSFGRNDFSSTPAVASSFITIGIVPLASAQAGMSTQSAVGSGQPAVVSAWVSPQAGVDSTLVIQTAGRGDERALMPWIGREAVDLFPFFDETQRGAEPAVDTWADSERPVRATGVYRADTPFAASKIDASHLAVDWALDDLVSKWRAKDKARGMSARKGELVDWTALSEEDSHAPKVRQRMPHGTGLHSASGIPAEMLIVPLQGSRSEVFSSQPQPTDLLLKAGLIGIGASVLTARTLTAERTNGKQERFRLRRESWL